MSYLLDEFFCGIGFLFSFHIYIERVVFLPTMTVLISIFGLDYLDSELVFVVFVELMRIIGGGFRYGD